MSLTPIINNPLFEIDIPQTGISIISRTIKPGRIESIIMKTENGYVTDLALPVGVFYFIDFKLKKIYIDYYPRINLNNVSYDLYNYFPNENILVRNGINRKFISRLYILELFDVYVDEEYEFYIFVNKKLQKITSIFFLNSIVVKDLIVYDTPDPNLNSKVDKISRSFNDSPNNSKDFLLMQQYFNIGSTLEAAKKENNKYNTISGGSIAVDGPTSSGLTSSISGSTSSIISGGSIAVDGSTSSISREQITVDGWGGSTSVSSQPIWDTTVFSDNNNNTNSNTKTIYEPKTGLVKKYDYNKNIVSIYDKTTNITTEQKLDINTISASSQTNIEPKEYYESKQAIAMPTVSPQDIIATIPLELLEKSIYTPDTVVPFETLGGQVVVFHKNGKIINVKHPNDTYYRFENNNLQIIKNPSINQTFASEPIKIAQQIEPIFVLIKNIGNYFINIENTVIISNIIINDGKKLEEYLKSVQTLSSENVSSENVSSENVSSENVSSENVSSATATTATRSTTAATTVTTATSPVPVPGSQTATATSTSTVRFTTFKPKTESVRYILNAMESNTEKNLEYYKTLINNPLLKSDIDDTNYINNVYEQKINFTKIDDFIGSNLTNVNVNFETINNKIQKITDKNVEDMFDKLINIDAIKNIIQNMSDSDVKIMSNNINIQDIAKLFGIIYTFSPMISRTYSLMLYVLLVENVYGMGDIIIRLKIIRLLQSQIFDLIDIFNILVSKTDFGSKKISVIPFFANTTTPIEKTLIDVISDIKKYLLVPTKIINLFKIPVLTSLFIKDDTIEYFTQMNKTKYIVDIQREKYKKYFYICLGLLLLIILYKLFYKKRN
jgi:hypothetical protein